MNSDKIYPTMIIRSQAEAIELLEKENKQLRERIDKAIEYIKTHTCWELANGRVLDILEGNNE